MDLRYREALRDYDAKVAVEFHKRFDKRIQASVPPLEFKILGLSTTQTMDVCGKVSSVRSAAECANRIIGDASQRSMD
jgi:hypothetical protein